MKDSMELREAILMASLAWTKANNVGPMQCSEAAAIASAMHAEIEKLRADLTQCTAAYNAGVLELAVATARCERAEAEAARMRAALVRTRELLQSYISYGIPQGGYSAIRGVNIIDAALPTPHAEDVK